MEQHFKLNQELEQVKYGVWVDGQFIWLDQENWVYEANDNQKQTYTNKSINLSITLQENYDEAAVLQEMKIHNLSSDKRIIKLFCSQIFSKQLSNRVSFFAPILQAIVHSYNDHYFLVNGMFQRRGIVQYCTDFQESRSLNNGKISLQPFSSRSSTSIFSLEGEMDANEELEAFFWLCTGNDESDVLKNNSFMQVNISMLNNNERNIRSYLA